MQFMQPITLEDLEREQRELINAIRQDKDWSGRDNLKNGRWRMVHNITDQIMRIKQRSVNNGR